MPVPASRASSCSVIWWRWRRRAVARPFAVAAVAVLALLGIAPPLSAVRLARLIDGLSQPVGVVEPGDGSGRLLVVEQGGKVRVWNGARLLPRPFLDVSSRIACCGERGLLGLAVDPRHERTGFVFVNLTNRRGDTELLRYRVGANPNRLRPRSRKLLLRIDQPYSNHNGGQLAFGPDGFLYMATGDGGAGGDPENRAQRLDNLLGKLLRVRRNGTPPPTNPFVGRAGDDRIWAYGLRNPWRFSFDRTRGDLFIADVGQGLYEEVNLQRAGSRGGENYGWSCREGFHAFLTQRCATGAPRVEPILEYDHDEGDCSVTGGHRYRGAAIPALAGHYVYGDYCSGRIYHAREAGAGEWVADLLLDTDLLITSFAEDAAGELLVVDHRGAVYRLLP